uniref:Sushi domain-containing protein n=1 Tax=Cyprinus carpio TaxID=7962 RepID=A0A8C2E6W7_CYPCA
MQRLMEVRVKTTQSIQEYNINVALDLNQSSLYKSPVIPRASGEAYSNALVCYKMPKLCLELLLENGFIYSHPSNKEKIFYSCKTGYKPFTGNWWDSVTCRKGSQFDDVHHGKLTLTLRDPETADVECDPGFMSTDRSIKCINGRWEKPVCKGQKCGPPPEVDYADTIELKKDEYNTGERVEYSCFNKYTLDLRPPFSKYLTCEQGEWSGNIKCLKPCTVTVEEMNRRGIGLAYADRQKMFTPHNDYITFMCQRGKDLVRAALRQQCNDGMMILPECV